MLSYDFYICQASQARIELKLLQKFACLFPSWISNFVIPIITLLIYYQSHVITSTHSLSAEHYVPM